MPPRVQVLLLPEWSIVSFDQSDVLGSRPYTLSYMFICYIQRDTTTDHVSAARGSPNGVPGLAKGCRGMSHQRLSKPLGV